MKVLRIYRCPTWLCDNYTEISIIISTSCTYLIGCQECGEDMELAYEENRSKSCIRPRNSSGKFVKK